MDNWHSDIVLIKHGTSITITWVFVSQPLTKIPELPLPWGGHAN